MSTAAATRLRARLAGQLAEAGWLRTPQWQAAFERIPRHLFAPRFTLAPGGGGGTFDGTRPDQRAAWLEAVYSDVPLLTEISADGVPTSSCSAPQVVVAMLEALDVSDGDTVLEIGTGTGWNAALLAPPARARSGHLHRHQRRSGSSSPPSPRPPRPAPPPRCSPTGTRAIQHGRPSTGSSPPAPSGTSPPAWIAQTRPGGLILGEIRGAFAGAMAHLTVDPSGGAHGTFRPEPFSFMPLRSGHDQRVGLDALGGLGSVAVSATGTVRDIHVGPAVLDEPDFAFFAQLCLPGTLTAPIAIVDGPSYFCLIDPNSRSWARIHDQQVTQGGQQRLWDTLEHAHHQWTGLDRPAAHQFHITITPDGQQNITTDHTKQSWRLAL